MKDALVVALALVALKKKLLASIALLALTLLPVTVCAPEAESAIPRDEIRSEVGASGRN